MLVPLRKSLWLVFSLASFALAFYLVLDLGFMIVYFAQGGGTGIWLGPETRKLVHDVVQAGPMAAFVGWGALVVGTALPGFWLGEQDRQPRAGISLASLAAFLSRCAMLGAGAAALGLILLILWRFVWIH
jgi:hypothetical protein